MNWSASEPAEVAAVSAPSAPEPTIDQQVANTIENIGIGISENLRDSIASMSNDEKKLYLSDPTLPGKLKEALDEISGLDDKAAGSFNVANYPPSIRPMLEAAVKDQKEKLALSEIAMGAVLGTGSGVILGTTLSALGTTPLGTERAAIGTEGLRAGEGLTLGVAPASQSQVFSTASPAVSVSPTIASSAIASPSIAAIPPAPVVPLIASSSNIAPPEKSNLIGVALDQKASYDLDDDFYFDPEPPAATVGASRSQTTPQTAPNSPKGKEAAAKKDAAKKDNSQISKILEIVMALLSGKGLASLFSGGAEEKTDVADGANPPQKSQTELKANAMQKQTESPTPKIASSQTLDVELAKNNIIPFPSSKPISVSQGDDVTPLPTPKVAAIGSPSLVAAGGDGGRGRG